MALRELNILNDCIEAISNQSLILDINNKAFLDDIQTLLVQYFETFNKVLNEMEYDNFSVDFFVDYGKLIIYPEKKMPEDLIYGGVSKSMLKKSRLNFDKIEKCK